MVLEYPNCGNPLHEIFFGDNLRRWRCMNCERIYSSKDWEIWRGELVKIWKSVKPAKGV